MCAMDPHPQNEPERLAALRALKLVGTAPEGHFDAVCRTAQTFFSVPICLVSLVEEHEQWFKAKCGLNVDSTPRAVSFCTHAILSDAVFVVQDATGDPHFAQNPLVTGVPHIRFYAGAPLVLQPGIRIGTLCIIDTAPRTFSAEQRRQLQDLAQIVVAHLRLHETSQASADLASQRERAEIALDHMRQGLVMLSADQRVMLFNARAPELLNLSETVLYQGASFAAIRTFQRSRGDFALVERSIIERVAGGDLQQLPSSYEWPRPDGTTLEVHGSCLPDGKFVYTFTDVTARKLTDAALQASEANYRLLVEGVSDHAIYMLDPLGRVKNWNSGAERIKGYTASEIIGQHFSCFYMEQDREQRVPEGALRTAEHLGAFKDEGWRVRKDGVRFWANVLIQPIRAGDGSLLGFTKITRDATQQRLSERALRASEARYRLLAENTSDIIIRCDLDTTRRYVSPAVFSVLGYKPEELIGTRPLDFVHPDDVEAYRHVLDDLSEQRIERAVSQQRYQHKNGTWVWTEVSFALTHDPADGRVTGYVASLRDISARKAAEQAAAESEARYRDAKDTAHNAILAQLAEGVIVTDAAGRLTLVNDAAAMIHGVSQVDIQPEDYSATYHLYTEDRLPYPTQALPLARAVRGETVEDARWRVKRPDGTEILAIGTARPLIGGGGQQVGAVLTLRDDTAREAAERALRESEAALRELNATLSERVAARTRDAEAARLEAERASAAKTQFLATMSHEIRTPLNGVLGFTDLLLDEPGLHPTLRLHGERIQAAGSALLTVVNDILDFSKVEAGQIELSNKPFRLDRLIDEATAIVRTAAEQKGLFLRVENAPRPMQLIGDAARLRQVLLNLLNNAVKFTRDGGVTLQVDIAAEGHDQRNRLRIAVRDTGIGIPEDKQHRLFQRFSQADASVQREFGGTGLGLAISKRLIELIGGTIGVESLQDQGSTFWFEVSLPEVLQATTTLPETTGLSNRVKRHILLVEDIPLNQELASAVLKRSGHTVDLVSSGFEAINAVRTKIYDLVLMDIQMPGMDGITATQLIRALPHPAASVPIIAMTANVLPHQVEEFRAAGIQGHIGKPFKRDALLAEIERCTSPAGEAPVPSGSSLDRQIFDEVVELLGRQAVNRLLAGLASELETRFGKQGSVPDRLSLARDAHAMVSASGSLGFMEFADLCHQVEAACNTNQEYTALFNQVQLCKQHILRDIAWLRAA